MHARQILAGVAGISIVALALAGSASSIAFMIAASDPVVPRLTRSLDAEWIGRGSKRARDCVYRRHVAGARHGIISERSRDQLTGIGVINRLLEKSLANSLDDAALDLPLHKDRFEKVAAVVDRIVSHDLDHADFRIDLNFGNVTAVGESLRGLGRSRRVERLALAPFGR